MADAPKAPDTPAPRDRTPRRSRKKKVMVEARRTKEFTYRGLTLGELQALSGDDLLNVLPARARRFFKRVGGHEEAQKLWAKVNATEEGGSIRTHLRDFPIIPILVGRTVEIHDGREFKKVAIVPEMIGHKLGEFALTRKPVKHTGPGVGATRSSKFMPLK